MANTWLRLYHDMPNDPKWRTIARAAKQTIPVVLAVYVHLLTIASGAVDRGTLMNVNSEDLASALDIDSEAVNAVLVAMQGRVLEGDKLSGWDKRQTNREDSSTERVKRWREKKVKPDVTHGNAMKRNVTHVKPDVTADKKREEEIKKEQKPSRSGEVDPRHVPFKLAVQAYMIHKGATFVWDGSEAKALDSLLKATPDLHLGMFQSCLNNRARSPGTPHGERPRIWLPNVTRYQNEPLNEFGKTGAGNGTFQGRTEHTVSAAQRVIQAIEDRHAAGNFGYPQAGEANRPGLPGVCE